MDLDRHRRHLLFSKENTKDLIEQLSMLKRNRSWVGDKELSPLHIAAYFDLPLKKWTDMI